MSWHGMHCVSRRVKARTRAARAPLGPHVSVVLLLLRLRVPRLPTVLALPTLGERPMLRRPWAGTSRAGGGDMSDRALPLNAAPSARSRREGEMRPRPPRRGSRAAVSSGLPVLPLLPVLPVPDPLLE